MKEIMKKSKSTVSNIWCLYANITDSDLKTNKYLFSV